MCMCDAYRCVCTCIGSTHGDQEKEADPQEQELYAVVCQLTCTLEPKSSKRATSSLNY